MNAEDKPITYGSIMTEPTDGVPGRWQEVFERMNEQFTDAFEQNMATQTAFADAWLDAIEETMADADDLPDDDVRGYMQAYETWMDAARQAAESMSDGLEGEDVSAETFRDTWLNAANRAFKEVMGTTAFAAATGQALEESLDLTRQIDEAAEASLHDMGLPTEDDIREVGERLVELERRQHAVENKLDGVEDKLDRVLAALEAEAETEATDSNQ